MQFIANLFLSKCWTIFIFHQYRITIHALRRWPYRQNFIRTRSFKNSLAFCLIWLSNCSFAVCDFDYCGRTDRSTSNDELYFTFYDLTFSSLSCSPFWHAWIVFWTFLDWLSSIALEPGLVTDQDRKLVNAVPCFGAGSASNAAPRQMCMALSFFNFWLFLGFFFFAPFLAVFSSIHFSHPAPYTELFAKSDR